MTTVWDSYSALVTIDRARVRLRQGSPPWTAGVHPWTSGGAPWTFGMAPWTFGMAPGLSGCTDAVNALGGPTMAGISA